MPRNSAVTFTVKLDPLRYARRYELEGAWYVIFGSNTIVTNACVPGGTHRAIPECENVCESSHYLIAIHI